MTSPELSTWRERIVDWVTKVSFAPYGAASILSNAANAARVRNPGSFGGWLVSSTLVMRQNYRHEKNTAFLIICKEDRPLSLAKMLTDFEINSLRTGL
jgi:hypothetical protein